MKVVYGLGISHKKLIEKLRVMGVPIERAVTKKDYLRQLEDIWNWKRPETSRVRFY
jgi:hypothetical protein